MVKRHRNSSSLQKRHVKVTFLDGTSSKIEAEVESTLRDVFTKACQSIGIVDMNLFGLAVFTEDNQPRFLDLDSKIAKQITKGLKAKENCEEPLLAVHLHVQFYIEKLSSIRDTNARNYYYRQLRHNFIDYPIMYPDDRCFLLAAYSMIAEDHDDNNSFDPRAFFPAWVVDKHKSKYIKEHLPSLRQKFSTLTKYDAQNLVATALCHETPIGYNMHLYRMAKEPNTKQQHLSPRNCSPKHCIIQSTGQCLQCTTCYFGVGPRGVETFEVGAGGFIQSLTQFDWKDISTIEYTKRRLEVVAKGITCVMYSPTDDLAKEICTICEQCHARHLSIERDSNRRSMSKSFRAKYRESYIDSANLEDDWNQGNADENLLQSSEFAQRPITSSDQYKKDRQNRYSIISDAASSSTSGIVSDRTCLSYYDSQEELLNGSKTITSSQDSLLEPSESSKCRPVQRATSEPSKKFEQLRELKVRQQHPPLMSRAASDDTVRSSQKVTDHIYENISEVRNRLMVAAQAKPSKLSPRVLLDPSFSFSKPQTSESQYRLQVQSQGALNYSMGQLNHLSSHTPAAFRSQYNIVKPSASMEQLLRDYQPPPSYNEKHKRVGEQMLAAMSQERLTSKSQESIVTAPAQTPSKETTYQKRQSTSKPIECTCRTTSYPEMDKLRDMIDLPMISALVKDKDLQASHSCQHCNNNNNQLHSVFDRPFSWHSETSMLPDSLPTVSTLAQDSY